jgi:hypothetical protein
VDYRSLFKGAYLAAVEFGGRTPTFTVANVKIVALEGEDGKSKDRGVVYFSETDRGLVLCKTNAILIAGMFGNDTDGWTGKRITLHATEVALGRERVLGVRVKGSPDLAEPVDVSVKLPKKKAAIVRMEKTTSGKGA